MAIRAKARQSSSRRGTPALAGRSTRSRPTRADRPAQRAIERHTVTRKTSTFAPTKAPAHGINSYAKALRFLNSLTSTAMDDFGARVELEQGQWLRQFFLALRDDARVVLAP